MDEDELVDFCEHIHASNLKLEKLNHLNFDQRPKIRSIYRISRNSKT